MYVKQTFQGLAACAILLAATQVFAQFEIPWHTIDGGGAMSSTGGGFEVAGTIGQSDAGSFTAPMSGGGFALVGGFWPVAAADCVPGDANVDASQNGRDIQSFVNCLFGVGGANCTCADISANGSVGNEDIAGFINLMLGL